MRHRRRRRPARGRDEPPSLSPDELEAIGARVDGFIAAVAAIRMFPSDHSDTVADAIDYGSDFAYAFEVAGWLGEDDDNFSGVVREWLLAHRAGFPYEFSVQWSGTVVWWVRDTLRGDF